MSTLKSSDPCTDLILDFIAGGVPGNPSGEAAGNYNAVIGNVRSRDDLSARTINGIYELQGALVARGMPSGAAGRYQNIQRTLRGLQTKLGLSGNELFTPEMQDRLAVELLKTRGYQHWWRGEMSDEDFAHGLSCEWASLPDPQNGGRSHYDGLAGNHASTTLAAVYAMLKQARATIGQLAPAAGDKPLSSSGSDDSASAQPNPKLPNERQPPANCDADQAAIMNMQLGLRLSGDYDGTVDGIWGPGSKAALIQFQARKA